MDDLHVDGGSADSLGRRELLRRGATLGAAMAVATPAVQALGKVSAFAQTSPAPPPPPPDSPPPPPPTNVTGISYIGLVFTCNGTEYRAKWEEGGGSGWSDVAGDELPQCPEPDGWDDAPVYPGYANIVVSKEYVGSELYKVTFTLPETCTASTGSGVAKGGNPTNPNSDGYCVAGVSDPANPRVIVFTAG